MSSNQNNNITYTKNLQLGKDNLKKKALKPNINFMDNYFGNKKILKLPAETLKLLSKIPKDNKSQENYSQLENKKMNNVLLAELESKINNKL